MRKFKLSITVDASGNATAYTPRVAGKLHSIIYVPDGSNPFANTVDFTVTAEATGETLLTRANVSAAFAAYPRMPTSGADGTGALYAAAGTAVMDKAGLANDRVKVVLAQGGNAKTGVFHILVD